LRDQLRRERGGIDIDRYRRNPVARDPRQRWNALPFNRAVASSERHAGKTSRCRRGASTWGNRGSASPLNPSQPTMEAGGCSPIVWKYGLTTGRQAQASNGEQPWKNISVSTCR
jgi:hypothetical protein